MKNLIKTSQGLTKYNSKGLLSITKNILNKDITDLWKDRLIEFFREYKLKLYQNILKEELETLKELKLIGGRKRRGRKKKLIENQEVVQNKLEENMSVKLKKLKFDFNIFIDICNLKNLEILKLRKLKIEKIPSQISNLEKLEYLNLNRNKIDDVSPLLGLKNLKCLNLEKNNIENLPEDFFENLKNLEYLNLKNNNLKKLPKGIEKLTNLKEIYLAENIDLILTKEEQIFCNKLEKCDLKSNELVEIDNSSLQNINFESLWRWADENNIPDLTWREIKVNSENLKSMNKFRCLGGLPRDEFKLMNLKKLDLRYFDIKTIPDELFKLEQLETLFLNNNSLLEISQDILNLKNLKKLTLQNNPNFRIKSDILHTLKMRGCKVEFD